MGDSEKLLYKALRKRATEFSTRKPYVTFTRSTGTEIVTVSERQIKICPLDSAQPHKLNIELGFEPHALVSNRSEQLLCLYNEKNVVVVTLPSVGSSLSLSTQFAVDLHLEEYEKVVQVVFHNVAKYQAEIVVLTNQRLLTYDINDSLEKPAYACTFAQTSANNSFDADEIVVDPVSLTFGDASSPLGELTLFILTADLSIFRIYPFLPRRLSVSKQWLADLFDLTSVTFQSLQATPSQSVQTLKFVALLSNSTGEVDVKKDLPKDLRQGKIVGPLPMAHFLDELYDLSALQLFPLSCGLLAVVLDHAVLVFDYESDGVAVFDSAANEAVDAPDQLSLLDSVLFDDAYSICSGSIVPYGDAIAVVTSKQSFVLIDYWRWMESLRRDIDNGDLSLFSGLFSKDGKLPTRVTNYGKVMPAFDACSADGVVYATQLNHVWYAWDGIYMYAVTPSPTNPDGLTILSLLRESDDDGLDAKEAKVPDFKSSSLKSSTGGASNSTADKYESLLRGTYKDEVERQLLKTQQLIAKVVKQLCRYPNHQLHSNSVEDLKLVYEASELVSKATVSLYGDIACVSKRLTQQRQELKNQITTLYEVKLKNDQAQPRAGEQSERIKEIQTKQALLKERMNKLTGECETILESKGKSKDEDLSREEVEYTRYLNTVRKFVKEKQAEEKQLKEYVDSAQESQKEDGYEIVGRSVPTQETSKLLQTFKKKLEGREQMIDVVIEGMTRLQF